MASVAEFELYLIGEMVRSGWGLLNLDLAPESSQRKSKLKKLILS
jgi:hypothetical protein